MKKFIRVAFIILFCLYCFILCYVLFLGSRPAGGSWAGHAVRSVNLVPLRSIVDYTKRFADGKVNLSSFLANIFGNILAFIPMGFFIPCIFKRANSFLKNLLICFSIVVCVEIVQLVTTVGSFDIDDIILNLTGSVLGHAIYRIRPIYNFVGRYR